MKDSFNEFLEHYGVKGMKWGVRKSKVPKQGPSDDAKGAHRSFVKAKTSGVEALSNKELKSLNERLNLEQSYSRLAYQPSILKRGMDSVKSMVGLGRTVNDVMEFANSPAGKKMAGYMGSKTVKQTAKKAKSS